jgi:phosphotransferase system  glucose/maltose/N-acetylglucosamine-specific IIC component
VMSCFLLTTFVGSFLCGLYVQRFYQKESWMAFFAPQLVLAVVVAVVFHFVALRFERNTPPVPLSDAGPEPPTEVV